MRATPETFGPERLRQPSPARQADHRHDLRPSARDEAAPRPPARAAGGRVKSSTSRSTCATPPSARRSSAACSSARTAATSPAPSRPRSGRSSCARSAEPRLWDAAAWAATRSMARSRWSPARRAGIGAATAQPLHARGASVALVDLQAPERVRRRAHARARRRRDRPRGHGRAVETTVARFGGLDVIVANAGIAPRVTTALAMDPDAFERVLEVDLLGVWRTVRAACRRSPRAAATSSWWRRSTPSRTAPGRLPTR